eukprot:Unigene13213_Nuclearia_a/m.40022 Unigene13213_Nuclearia_a/g.40022  ORF Unigene13213_Nuclearia_a/g.40022 Unigene13213_Nuclearia_a/m.40022 type:complete len:116 (+) Unigene13213_Nuclearia_a:711-1058(+)
MQERGWGAPRLALNAVGGRSATDLARLLACVEWGHVEAARDGAERAADLQGAHKGRHAHAQGWLTAHAAQDVRLRGFWMTHWTSTHTAAQRAAMLEELAALHRCGAPGLRAPGRG